MYLKIKCYNLQAIPLGQKINFFCSKKKCFAQILIKQILSIFISLGFVRTIVSSIFIRNRDLGKSLKGITKSVNKMLNKSIKTANVWANTYYTKE